jgi:hypothetical protein
MSDEMDKVKTFVETLGQRESQKTATPPEASPTAKQVCRKPMPALLSPPPTRDFFAIAAAIALCDVTIFRGSGFAGVALLLAIAPLLLALGTPRPHGGKAVGVVVVMLWLVAFKLLWGGHANFLLAAAGFFLLGATASALHGAIPYIWNIVYYIAQCLWTPCLVLPQYWFSVIYRKPPERKTHWMNLLLPLAALVVFGVIFVLANPDLAKIFGEGVRQFFVTLHEWIHRYFPSWGEVAFWAVVLWIVVGLLRPVIDARIVAKQSSEQAEKIKPDALPAAWHGPCRNMLLVLIVLFAGYLTYEYQTLWFQKFPKGFCYSGYAHEGAAWLTVALALSTAVLSLIFRGSMLHSSRLPTLRRLAWIWSMENIVLALAAYHRLYIYIGFNGMTRLRVVGILGMSAVVVGFVAVLWKILQNRNFIWLARRHSWTLAAAVFLYAVLPVDWLVMQYNVSRIMAGDSAPAVQITEHAIDAEGLIALTPLLDCKDQIVRDGIAALLATRLEVLQSLELQQQREGWTSYQLADAVALRKLSDASTGWPHFADDPVARRNAIEKFRKYAYQWY